MSTIKIVLVRPKYSGNLGSTARAMKNMGLDSLRLISPEADPQSAAARRMAPHAQEVLESATSFKTLAEGIKDLDLVVGFTRRQGGDREEPMLLEDFALWLAEENNFKKIGLVFGPEDKGLLKEDLKFCQRLVVIPSSLETPSLNLAQAVMVVAYELFKKDFTKPKQTKLFLATSEAKESFYADLEKLLQESGFLNPQNPLHTMQLLRHLFNRAFLQKKEVSLLRGVLRQVRWWASQKK